MSISRGSISSAAGRQGGNDSNVRKDGAKYYFTGLLSDEEIKEIDKAYGRLILCPGYQLLRLYDDEDLLVLPSSMQGKSEVMKKLKSWSESQKNPLHSWWPRLAREKKIPLLTVSDILRGLHRSKFEKYREKYLKESTQRSHRKSIEKKKAKAQALLLKKIEDRKKRDSTYQHGLPMQDGKDVQREEVTTQAPSTSRQWRPATMEKSSVVKEASQAVKQAALAVRDAEASLKRATAMWTTINKDVPFAPTQPTAIQIAPKVLPDLGSAESSADNRTRISRKLEKEKLSKQTPAKKPDPMVNASPLKRASLASQEGSQSSKKSKTTSSLHDVSARAEKDASTKGEGSTQSNSATRGKVGPKSVLKERRNVFHIDLTK